MAVRRSGYHRASQRKSKPQSEGLRSDKTFSGNQTGAEEAFQAAKLQEKSEAGAKESEQEAEKSDAEAKERKQEAEKSKAEAKESKQEAEIISKKEYAKSREEKGTDCPKSRKKR